MTTTPDDAPEAPRALGLVVDEDRGSLPYALVHDEALVARAAWALDDAGVGLVDVGTPWAEVRDEGSPLVLQDALCPLTPPAFVARCVRRAVADDVVVVGVRPVTDTVKVVHDEQAGATVGETVDREGLAAVASPVVLPASVLAGMARPPGPNLARLVSELVDAGHRVALVEAPSLGRRVSTPDELRVLEALSARRAGSA